MTSKSRLLMFAAALISYVPTTMNASINIDYQNADIANVTSLVKSNKVSCRQLVLSYIQRIMRYDLAYSKSTPPINAIISINPAALSEADQIDHLKANKETLPLLCVPVVVKDNIDTVDTPSTSGSLSLLGSQPNKDAILVSKLRKAGAIIVGKAGMDEFASGTWGINSRLGRTGNPYNTNLLPGGSSSGPAAAVNAGFALIGIGTDNSGSLRIPAAANGLYTIRGGTGTVSQQGIFPRGNLDGIAGVIARNVRDVAKVMDVMAVKNSTSYVKYLSANELNGKRIGIIKQYGDQKVNYSGIGGTYTKAMRQMSKLGASMVANVVLKDFITNRSDNTAGEVQQINAYLGSFPSTRKNFESICRSGRTIEFGTQKKCLQYAKANPPVDSKRYKAVLKNFVDNRTTILRIMNKKRLNALLLPISEAGIPNNHFDNQYYTIVSPNSGLPAVEFIVGYAGPDNTLPVAMQLIGKPGSEPVLLGMAYAVSQLISRQEPKLPVATLKIDGATIAKFNNFKTLVGYNIYQQVIHQHGVNAVTAQRFNQIYQQTYHAYWGY